MRRRKKVVKHRGIYEHPKGSGAWWIQYFVGSKRCRERVGLKSEAVARYQLRKTQTREGDLPKRRPNRLLSDFIDRFVEGQRHRMRSWNDYVRFGRYWSERFKGRTLRSILPMEIETWANRRIQEVSPATANHELSFLRRVFNVALANDLVDRNPVKKVQFFKEPSGRVRFLTDEEEVRLRQELGEKHWSLVSFALDTGLRQAEQLHLRWADVNMVARVLTVPRSKHGETRHLQLNEGALAVLRATPRRLHSELVFSTANGTAINPANLLHRVFNPALQRADIKDFRWHDLRHTFASRLAMEGVDLRTVQELLGHKTLAMTLRYSHLAPAHLHNAIRALDSRRSATSTATKRPPKQQT